jgi:hypothetical protein
VPAAQKYQTKKSEWELGVPTANGGTGGTPTPATGFYCLKFEMNQPQYYSYGYKGGTSTGGGGAGAGQVFTATATGDLDGDGNKSTFTLQGAEENGRMKVATTIDEQNPEE